MWCGGRGGRVVWNCHEIIYKFAIFNRWWSLLNRMKELFVRWLFNQKQITHVAKKYTLLDFPRECDVIIFFLAVIIYFIFKFYIVQRWTIYKIIKIKIKIISRVTLIKYNNFCFLWIASQQHTYLTRNYLLNVRYFYAKLTLTKPLIKHMLTFVARNSYDMLKTMY